MNRVLSLLNSRYVGLVAIVFAFILVAAFGAFQINDPDTLQYLAQGREIAQHGFSKECVFNYTSETCQIAFNEWGFHTILYSIYSAAGWVGLSIFQLTLALLLFGLLFLLQWRNRISPWIIALVLIAAVYVAMDRFMLRADLMVLNILVGVYWLSRELNARLANNGRIKFLIMGLLALQLIWANIHGSFPLGWLVIGSVFGEALLKQAWLKFKRSSPLLTRPVKILFLVTLGAVIVSALNPYGIGALILPFKFYFGPSEFHSQLEFQSTFAPMDLTRHAVKMYSLLLWSSIIILLLNIKKLRLGDVFIFIVFAYLSIKHVRYIAIFAIVLALILPAYIQNIAHWVNAKLTSRKFWTVISPISKLALIIFLIITSVHTTKTLANDSFYLYDQRSRTFGFELSQIAYPAGAVEFIKANQLQGNMFHDYGSGTYLNWAMGPGKTFIDGHSYTLELLQYHNRVMSGEVPFEEVATKYEINYVMLNFNYDSSLFLAKKLYNDPNWPLVYIDDNSLVFVKAEQQNLAVIQNGVDIAGNVNFDANKLMRDYVSVADRSRAWAARGQILATLGFTELAKQQFENAAEANSQNYIALTSLGAIRQQLNQMTEALQAYQAAERVNSNYAPLQLNLGLYYLSQQKLDEAKSSLERALDINSRYKFAHFNLGQIYEKQNNLEKAKQEYQAELAVNPNEPNSQNALTRLAQSDTSAPSLSITELEEKLKIDPNNVDLLVQLGVAYGTSGKNELALEQFKKAVAAKPDSVIARQNLANAYAQMNQFPEAVKEYEQVLILDSKNADAELNLGVINYYQLHDEKAAVEHFQKFLELVPNDPQAPQIQQLINTIIQTDLTNN